MGEDKARQPDTKAVGEDRSQAVDQKADKTSDVADQGQEADRLGQLADTEGQRLGDDDGESFDTHLQQIQASFHWVDRAAQEKLEKLRRDIKRDDEPSLLEHIMETVIEIALGAGAGAAGEYLATRLVAGAGHEVATAVKSAKEEAVHEGGKEFAKIMFEEGINTGVAAGKEKLSALRGEAAVDAFIDSQKDAVASMHQANQADFIHNGRRNLSKKDASELAAACQTGASEAGQLQYGATRDAWVQYLARSEFGVNPAKDGKPETTNMLPQDRRELINHGAPHYVPDQAPEIGEAALGRAPGVLEVVARLPAITDDVMASKPEVEIAFLNDVNDTLREQYVDKPLAEAHIPRQVVAKVDGAMPNFTINIDEIGRPSNLTYAQGTWLRARATVKHPENAAMNDYAKRSEGLELLLQELTPHTIRRKL